MKYPYRRRDKTIMNAIILYIAKSWTAITAFRFGEHMVKEAEKEKEKFEKRYEIMELGERINEEDSDSEE